MAIVLLAVALRGQTSGTLYPSGDDPKLQVGTTAFRLSKQTVRAIYHEDFDYIGGVLTIRGKMQIVDRTNEAASQSQPMLQLIHSAITSDICGATITHPDADLVQVSCVDYDALRVYMPFLTTTGKETQVLIHARKGRNGGTIYVTADGVNWRKGTQSLDAYGRLVTLITFPGVGYKTVEFDIP